MVGYGLARRSVVVCWKGLTDLSEFPVRQPALRGAPGLGRPPKSERRGLFLSDPEIARRLGVGERVFRAFAQAAEPDGFPKKHAVFGRRWWPAVKAWFDRAEGASVGSSLPGVEENLDEL